MHKFATDVEAWAELDRLLDEALDLPAPQRVGWIEALAPRFEELKPRLRELLLRRPGVATDDFLNRLPQLDFDAGDWAPAGARVDQPGDQVGPYRLVRELGGGGMGTVWLAERTDGLINRPVALKLPRGAWRRAGLAERMAREREMPATLNHPNVARLYDAGLTPDGQPYLALEYVDGCPFDEYCRDRQLDVRARLRLFTRRSQQRWRTPTASSSCTGTWSPTTSSSPPMARYGCWTSESRSCSKKTTRRKPGSPELSGRALTPDYASPEQILGEPLSDRVGRLLARSDSL